MMEDIETTSQSSSKEERPRKSAMQVSHTETVLAQSSSRFKIDREKTCPTLIRMFCREGGHHKIDDFYRKSTLPIDDELVIYTWKDATLKELSSLIKEVHLESRPKNIKFDFRILNREMNGNVHVRHMGVVYNNGKKSYTPMHPPRGALEKVADEERNLDDARFIPGDYIDVAILDSYAQLPSNDGMERGGARARTLTRSDGRDRSFVPERARGPLSMSEQRPTRRSGY